MKGTKITFESFERSFGEKSSGGTVGVALLLVGTERYKTQRVVKQCAQNTGLKLKQIDGSVGEPLQILSDLLDDLRTPTLFGGQDLFVMSGAERVIGAKPCEKLLPELESELFSEGDGRGLRCIFVADALDSRKKSTKWLTQNFSVMECSEVKDFERDGWITKISKQLGLDIPLELRELLLELDPWNLDLIEQELKKWDLSGQNREVISIAQAKGELSKFSDFIFARSRGDALSMVPQIAHSSDPSQSVMLLGLLAWNSRQLIALKTGGQVQASGQMRSKLENFASEWNAQELFDLTHDLKNLDFTLKQTKQDEVGAWTRLALKYTQ